MDYIEPFKKDRSEKSTRNHSRGDPVKQFSFEENSRTFDSSRNSCKNRFGKVQTSMIRQKIENVVG